LVGVGGVGKTRLALQSSAILAPRFSGGVWLIELAAVTDGGEVDAAVAAVFMLQPRPGRSWREIVVESLRDREVLLVIDNCEHVLDDVAALVNALGECLSMRVVVTSRESLAVAGEWAFRVPSLAVSSSVELFVERADTASAGFRPNDDDLRVIGEICHRLDGIPLAIELAAARVRAMSPAQIRDRLDERFRLLTGSRRAIERHQTLRHAVQWSYDLLEPTEQTVLQQVSVFVGGFALNAATAITGLDEFEVLDVLDSLIRKSLLQVERSDGDVRYRMLETIRQFAEEALADTGTGDELRSRHAVFFADQAEVNFGLFRSEDERLAYRWVNAEIANLGAAFGWALVSRQADPAVRIAANVHLIARAQLRTETFGWPETAIELARQSEHRQLPLLLTMACNAATGTGRFDEGLRYGLEAVALNDDARYDFAINAYSSTGMAVAVLDDVDGALRMCRTGAEHPEDHPARANLGFLHVLANAIEISLPEQEIDDAITQLAASSMPSVRGMGWWVQSMLAARSDVPAAIALDQQAIDIAVETGCRTLAESVRGHQLGLIIETDDLDAALDGFAGVVDAWQVMGDIFTQSGMHALTVWLARLGYHDGAARLYGAVTKGYRSDVWTATPEVSTLADALGETALNDAYQAGAALDLRSAGELAHQLLAQVRSERTAT
jgi:predicted ATPase